MQTPKAPRRRGTRGDARGRGYARAAGVVGAAIGVMVLSALPAAAAANTTVDSPTSGTTYTASATVTASGSATYANGDTGTLSVTITDPARNEDSSGMAGCSFPAGDPKNYSGSSVDTSSTVAGMFDLSAIYPKSCGTALTGKPAINGTWQVTATATGSTTNRTFVVKIPPTVPANVSGASTAPLSATLTWAQDPETDTHAYAILDGSSNVVGGPYDTSICASNVCSKTVTGLSASGNQSFSIRAYRYTDPSTSSDVTGDLVAQSAPVTVAVMAGSAASPGPSASASTDPSAAPSSGANPTASATSADTTEPKATGTASPAPSLASGTIFSGGGSGKVSIGSKASGSQAAKLAQEFTNFAPASGIDKLPPLPKLASSGTVVGVTPPPVASTGDDGEPTDQGTFKLSLGYGPESKVVATQHEVSGPLSSVADAIGLTPVSLWRSVAGSLLLLLAAAHVRRWARKPIE